MKTSTKSIITLLIFIPIAFIAFFCNLNYSNNSKSSVFISKGDNINNIPNSHNYHFTTNADNNAFITYGNQEPQKLLVLMYHNVIPNHLTPNHYAIRAVDLERDFYYLKKNNCNVISPEYLIYCKQQNKPLPPNSVLISFDDGFESIRTLALPLLKKYDYCATIAIVGEYLQIKNIKNNAGKSYAYLDKKDLQYLSNQPNLNFAHHSSNLHHLGDRKGVIIKVDESFLDYEDMFLNDERFLKNIFDELNIHTSVYAYPFGNYCKESQDILQSLNYNIVFTCNEGINVIDYDKSFLSLRRYNISGIDKNAQQLIDFYIKFS